MNFIFVLYSGFVISIVLFLVAVFLLVRASRTKNVKSISNQLTNNVYEDSIQVLEQTRKESEEIIQDALKKAESTISEAEFISKGAQEEFAKEIHDAEERAVHQFGLDNQKSEVEFQKLFDTIRAQFESQTQKTMSMLEGVVQKEAESFRSALQSQTIEAERQVQAKVQNEFSSVSREIEEYKKAQIQGINNAVNSVVKDIVAKVLQKSITPQDHSQLVMNAFEKAFQEGLVQKNVHQNISN